MSAPGGTTVLVRAKVIEPNGHVHYSSMFTLVLDQTLFEQISTLQKACSIKSSMDEYDICAFDRPLPAHARVGTLQLRSGDCLVLHHLRDDLAPELPTSVFHDDDPEMQQLLEEARSSYALSNNTPLITPLNSTVPQFQLDGLPPSPRRRVSIAPESPALSSVSFSSPPQISSPPMLRPRTLRKSSMVGGSMSAQSPQPVKASKPAIAPVAKAAPPTFPTFSGLKLRDSIDGRKLSGRSLPLLTNQALLDEANDIHQQFRRDLGADRLSDLGFHPSTAATMPGSAMSSPTAASVVAKGKTPAERLTNLVARSVLDEVVGVAVAAVEERRLLEAVGGCLHSIIETVDARVQAPQAIDIFDRQFAALRDSWNDCSADLSDRLQDALSQPIHIGPSLLRDTTVGVDTKHDITAFLDRLTFSADMPASLNPARHISTLVSTSFPSDGEELPNSAAPIAPGLVASISTHSFNPARSQATVGVAASAPTSTLSGAPGKLNALRHGQAIRDCLNAHSQTVSFLCDIASDLIDLQEVHETALMVDKLSATLPSALLAVAVAQPQSQSQPHLFNHSQMESNVSSPVSARSQSVFDEFEDEMPPAVLSPRRLASHVIGKNNLKDERDATNQSYSLQQVAPASMAQLSARHSSRNNSSRLHEPVALSESTMRFTALPEHHQAAQALAQMQPPSGTAKVIHHHVAAASSFCEDDECDDDDEFDQSAAPSPHVPVHHHHVSGLVPRLALPLSPPRGESPFATATSASSSHTNNASISSYNTRPGGLYTPHSAFVTERTGRSAINMSTSTSFASPNATLHASVDLSADDDDQAPHPQASSRFSTVDSARTDALDSPVSTIAESARDRPQPKRPAAVPPLPLARLALAPSAVSPSKQSKQQHQQQQQQQQQQQPKQAQKPAQPAQPAQAAASSGLTRTQSGHALQPAGEHVGEGKPRRTPAAKATPAAAASASSAGVSRSGSQRSLTHSNSQTLVANQNTASTTSLSSAQSQVSTPSQAGSMKLSLSTAKRMEQPLRSTDLGSSVALAKLHQLHKMSSIKKQISGASTPQQAAASSEEPTPRR